MTDEVVDTLRAAGCVFAEDEAALLRAEARDASALSEMLARRVTGEPLEQVVGWAAFMGLRVVVEPTVFVPRRRTGLLVELALEEPFDVAVDLGCGSGAVAAALLDARPDAEVHAADVDPAAVRCARRNVPLVHLGDLYEALPDDLRGRVDVVVANAPYVPTDEIASMPTDARDHESLVALDGGADGMVVQRRVVAGAPSWLRPGGRLVVETSRRHAERLLDVFGDAGLTARVVRNEDLDATAVVGVSPPG